MKTIRERAIDIAQQLVGDLVVDNGYLRRKGYGGSSADFAEVGVEHLVKVLEQALTPPKTREQLRQLARVHGVPRGRNTRDTIANLRKAGITISS